MSQVNAGLAGVVALEGCCAVALTIGTAANQTVVQGSDLCMVEYDDQVYRMATTAGRDKFLRSPELYFEAELPAHAAAIDHGKAPSVGKLTPTNRGNSFGKRPTERPSAQLRGNLFRSGQTLS